MKILIAASGAPHSEVALRFATHLIQSPGDAVTILTVIKHKSDQARANGVLAHAHDLIAASVPTLTTKVRLGHSAEEIIREAEEGQYDFVVIGDRQHHSLVTRFLMGATAERVVEHAPCPVIIAKGTIQPIKHILLCDSGISDPPLLDRFAEQLSKLFTRQEEVTVLHVMSQISAGPGVIGQQLRADAASLIDARTPEGDLLARDLQGLQQLHFRAQPKVRHGGVVDEIVAEAQSGRYDLVVIGAHRSEGQWRRILLDDLARQIIAQIDRPILVIR